jgi:hypothetical protein
MIDDDDVYIMSFILWGAREGDGWTHFGLGVFLFQLVVGVGECSFGNDEQ